MKKTKARFYTAIWNHKDGKAMKKIVDGFIFNYQDMIFGIYKRCNDAYDHKYVVIDIDTGLMVLTVKNIKMINICMWYTYNRIKKIYKKNEYANIIKEYSKLEIDEKSDLSKYHWDEYFIDLTETNDEDENQ